jgi:undecaprenyl diphosphate synthase
MEYFRDVAQAKVPKHVAIIMDGNRRWAEKWGLAIEAGHWKGAETLFSIVESSIKLGIKVLTVYAFSTENWGRSKKEVDSIMQLLEVYLKKMQLKMKKNGVKLRTIGDLSPFSDGVKNIIDEAKRETSDGNVIDLVLALNYGGRDDLRRATIRIVKEVQEGRLQKEEISEAVFATYLDTAEIGDPDLVIRTSGEKRISNFLLWQISYSEVHLTDVLWPDFTEKDLVQALKEYNERNRRLGN